jgi:DNA-binding MarR family transcriptional regulator
MAQTSPYPSDKELKPLNLNFSQYKILAELATLKAGASEATLGAKQWAKDESLSRLVFRELVQNLQDRGMVSRRASSVDAILHITKTGVALYRAAHILATGDDPEAA